MIYITICVLALRQKTTAANKKLNANSVCLLHSTKYVIKNHFGVPVKWGNFHALSNAARGRSEACTCVCVSVCLSGPAASLHTAKKRGKPKRAKENGATEINGEMNGGKNQLPAQEN